MDLYSHELLRPVAMEETGVKPGDTRRVAVWGEPGTSKYRNVHAIVWSAAEVWSWVGELKRRPTGPRW